MLAAILLLSGLDEEPSFWAFAQMVRACARVCVRVGLGGGVVVEELIA